MRIDANPNRMELMRLRGRRQIAARGHKLLRDKQEELLRRFYELLPGVRALRRLTEDGLREVNRWYQGTRVIAGDPAVATALERADIGVGFEVSTRRLLNLSVPVVTMIETEGDTGEGGPGFGYGYDVAPAELDQTLLSLRRLLPSLLDLLSREAALRMLAAELETTRRRVMALEHVLIPALDEAIRGIMDKLSEQERATATRLMKIKDMLEAS